MEITGNPARRNVRSKRRANSSAYPNTETVTYVFKDTQPHRITNAFTLYPYRYFHSVLHADATSHCNTHHAITCTSYRTRRGTGASGDPVVRH